MSCELPRDDEIDFLEFKQMMLDNAQMMSEEDLKEWFHYIDAGMSIGT